MNNFSPNTRKEIYKRDHNQCTNHTNDKCKVDVGLTIHHIVHNTILNRKLYGNKNIQSAENGVVLCIQCHTNYSLIPFVNKKRKELINKWEAIMV